MLLACDHCIVGSEILKFPTPISFVMTSTPPGNGKSVVDQPESSQQARKDITIHEFSKLLPSTPAKFQCGSQPQRQIHRVPQQLRLKGQESNHLYEPVLVSLGPYHHGEPKLCQAEEFKLVCLDWFALQSKDNKMNLYNKILANINEIRGCYAEVSILEKYDDKKLALMMLLDACFIINFMHNLDEEKVVANNFSEWRNFLGVATAIQVAAHDIMLLENQVPFKVLELIISEKGGNRLFNGFMSWMLSIKLSQATIPNKDDDPPLHLLEACWRVIVGENDTDHQHVIFTQRNTEECSEPSCPSVSDLRKRGIRISPRPSHSLIDIRFKSNPGSGLLELPVLNIFEQTQVILTNLIAYELSPGTTADLAVLSYTKFMKSLIQFSEDVTLLHGRGILCIGSASPEHVVQVFKNIDTFGLNKFDSFKDTKHRIGVHYSCFRRTWFATLTSKCTRHPWTALGFVISIETLLISMAALLFTAIQAILAWLDYKRKSSPRS